MAYRNPFDDEPAAPAPVKPNPFDDGRASPRAAAAALPAFGSPPPVFSSTFDEFAVLSPQQQVPRASPAPLDLGAALKDLGAEPAVSPRGAQGQGQGSLLQGPKAAGRTLRRSQLPPDLRERSKSIETKKLTDIFDSPPQQSQQQQQQGRGLAAPLSPRTSAEPSPPPPPVSNSPPPPAAFQADFSHAPSAAAAAAASLRLVATCLCSGLRGAPRVDAQTFALGEEFAFRAEAAGFSRDAEGAAHLVCRYHIAGPGGKMLAEGEHSTRAHPAVGTDLVEIGVAIPLMFDAATTVGACQFRLNVSEGGASGKAATSFVHSFSLTGWGFGLRQARLLVEGRPLQVPAVFPFQELAASAVVTLEAGMEGVPEAFFTLRDVASGLPLIAEPQPCQVIAHPRLAACFALVATASVARPGAYQLLLAVKHGARPGQLLRHDLQFAVVHFQ